MELKSIGTKKELEESKTVIDELKKRETTAIHLIKYYQSVIKPDDDGEILLEKVKDSTRISLTKASQLTDEIQKNNAIKRLKFQLHPDKHPNDLSWLFTEMFKIVNV